MLEDYQKAYEETVRLAKNMHLKYYSDVTQWEPLDDIVGVISQIDNMVAGLYKINTWTNGSHKISWLNEDEIVIYVPYRTPVKMDGGDFEGVLNTICSAQKLKP